MYHLASNKHIMVPFVSMVTVIRHVMSARCHYTFSANVQFGIDHHSVKALLISLNSRSFTVEKMLPPEDQKIQPYSHISGRTGRE